VELTPLQNAIAKADDAEFMLNMLKKLKVDYGFRSIQMAKIDPEVFFPWSFE